MAMADEGESDVVAGSAEPESQQQSSHAPLAESSESTPTDA